MEVLPGRIRGTVPRWVWIAGVGALLVAVVGATALAVTGRFLIYHWWTNPGEKEAVDAMLAILKQRHPGLEIVENPVAGGAGVEMKAVLKSLLLAGRPPDTFQVHAGAEAEGYIQGGLMEPIDFLWESEGWTRVYPQSIQEVSKYQGHFYVVPVNVHRSNMVWYVKPAFDRTGLAEPTTADELFAAAQKLQAAGYTPFSLASRQKWDAAHAFEVLLGAVAGPELYVQYFRGQISASHPKFIEALRALQRLVSMANRDHAALTWDQAVQRLIDGRGVMNIMGDWAKGYLTSSGWRPGVDFGAFPLPQGVFTLVIDSFGLPKGAPNREATIEWLKVVGSVAGQQAFNPIKGSVPARIDAPLDPYDAISRRNMADLKTNVGIPSAVHGSIGPDPFMADFNDIIGRFVYTGDIETTVRELDAAAQRHGLRR